MNELERVRAQLGIAAVALGRIADGAEFNPPSESGRIAREALLRMRQEQIADPFCPCGHRASSHPPVWSVAGDASTACRGYGCRCRDYDGPPVQ